MPSLSDFPRAGRAIGYWTLCKRIIQQIGEDGVTTLAASMSYSWLFALFPFLIFLMTLAPYIPGIPREHVSEVIDGFVQQIPGEGAKILGNSIKDVINQPNKGLLSVGIIVAIWAASGGMATTTAALNRCYDVTDRPFYIQRPLAMLLTVIEAALILTVVLILPVAGLITAWLQKHPSIDLPVLKDISANSVGILLWILSFARWGFALLLLFAALALMYHFAPRVKQTFRFLTPGSVFVVGMWIALGLALNYYISHFGQYNKTYGAIGGVIIVLFIFYVDSVVLLIGAEINSEIDLAVNAKPDKPGDFRVAKKKRKGKKFPANKSDSDYPKGIAEPIKEDPPAAVTPADLQ